MLINALCFRVCRQAEIKGCQGFALLWLFCLCDLMTFYKRIFSRVVLCTCSANNQGRDIYLQPGSFIFCNIEGCQAIISDGQVRLFETMTYNIVPNFSAPKSKSFTTRFYLQCPDRSTFVQYFPLNVHTTSVDVAGEHRPTSMMTSSNGNNFRVTGHLCGEFTGPRWIPCTKASDAELWCFLWSAFE